MTTAKFAKKLYTSGYWQAARQLPAATFGTNSVCREQYLRGYEVGRAAYLAGRAQRTMVWSTERAPVARARKASVVTVDQLPVAA